MFSRDNCKLIGVDPTGQHICYTMFAWLCPCAFSLSELDLLRTQILFSLTTFREMHPHHQTSSFSFLPSPLSFDFMLLWSCHLLAGYQFISTNCFSAGWRQGLYIHKRRRKEKEREPRQCEESVLQVWNAHTN